MLVLAVSARLFAEAGIDQHPPAVVSSTALLIEVRGVPLAVIEGPMNQAVPFTVRQLNGTGMWGVHPLLSRGRAGGASRRLKQLHARRQRQPAG